MPIVLQGLTGVYQLVIGKVEEAVLMATSRGATTKGLRLTITVVDEMGVAGVSTVLLPELSFTTQP